MGGVPPLTNQADSNAVFEINFFISGYQFKSDLNLNGHIELAL
jgi:hypothetical protein